MHNEERERRDNRPKSAGHVAERGQPSVQTSRAAVDARILSPRVVPSAGMPAAGGAASARKKPVHLNRDDDLRLQLNLSDADEVGITIAPCGLWGCKN